LITVMMPPLSAQNCTDPPPPLGISLAVNPSPSVFGQNVSVTVITTPLTGCPPATGSVQLQVDNSSFGNPVTLDANGDAIISIPDASHNIPGPLTVFPSVGAHSVSVVYGGPPGQFNYPAAVSPPVAATVNQANSVTTLNLSGATLTAIVSAVAPGSGSPAGTVQFKNGTTPIGTFPVGQASINTTGLAGLITATYSGNVNYIGSTSTPLRVGPAPTSSLALSASVDPSTIGQSVDFTATLTVANGDGPPVGTIQFSDGTKLLGSPVALSLGQAIFTTSSLAVGSHTIHASYSGDSQYPAAGLSIGQVVNPVATVLTLSAAPSTAGSGQTVTLTAQFGQPPTGVPGPTGQVTFSEGNSALGVSPVVSGAATLQLNTLTSGVHQIFAVYSGDADWSSARSSAVAVAVNVKVDPLTILTTSPLPDALAGVAYTAPPMSASGGLPPLQWSITQTAPTASGVLLASDGTFSGTPPSSAGGKDFTLTIQVTDAQNTKVNKQFTLHVTSLLITTQTLPGGTTGSTYSASVAASGGTKPYTFSGSLPSNLTIDPASGAISGTPTVSGTVQITVTVTDSASPKATATKTFNVAFALPSLPPLTFGGVGDTGSPGTQPALQLTLGAGFPVDITGTLKLTFSADKGGGNNPEVKFSNGATSLPFRIPANSTSIPNLQLQTGTVAGVITITVALAVGSTDITPTPVPKKLITVSAAPPTIVSVVATRTATGFTVVVTGFSTTVDVSQAIFQFSGTSGLQTTSLTVPVGTLFGGFYQTATPGPTGSQFVYTQPFTVSGNLQAVTSVSVTMVNSSGNSQVATAPIQ
jgi:hypothetical protein